MIGACKSKGQPISIGCPAFDACRVRLIFREQRSVDNDQWIW